MVSSHLPFANGGEDSFGRISNFQGLVNLTLDRVILHIVVHHLSTSAKFRLNQRNVMWTDGRTDARTMSTVKYKAT